MNYCQCNFDTYSASDNALPVPENLKGKDVRADPAARAAVFCSTAVIEGVADIDLRSLNIIVVNREGCASHLHKVVTAIAKRIPRQGLFARGGPQMLATYAALAIGCNGAAFTLVGSRDALAEAITMALYLAGNGTSSGTILTVVVNTGRGRYDASSALIRPADVGSPLAVSEQQAEITILERVGTILPEDNHA